MNNVEAHRFWLEQGVSPERLQLAVDPDGTHDPIFMSRRFPDALRWLFVGEAEEQVSAKGRAQHEDPDIQEKHELYNDQDKQDKQDNQVKAPLFSVPGTLTWSMQSDETGREYRIFIAEPMGPPPEGGYPVLYSLDANATFGTLAEAIRLQYPS